MNSLKIVLQLLLVGLFAYFGFMKIIGAPDMVAAFQSFNYADWFMRFVGILEVGAAICLLIGTFSRNLGILINVAGFIIMILTIGAVCSHFFRQKNIGEGMIPLVVGLIMVAILVLHNRNNANQITT